MLDYDRMTTNDMIGVTKVSLSGLVPQQEHFYRHILTPPEEVVTSSIFQLTGSSLHLSTYRLNLSTYRLHLSTYRLHLSTYRLHFLLTSSIFLLTGSIFLLTGSIFVGSQPKRTPLILFYCSLLFSCHRSRP